MTNDETTTDTATTGRRKTEFVVARKAVIAAVTIFAATVGWAFWRIEGVFEALKAERVAGCQVRNSGNQRTRDAIRDNANSQYDQTLVLFPHAAEAIEQLRASIKVPLPEEQDYDCDGDDDLDAGDYEPSLPD